MMKINELGNAILAVVRHYPDADAQYVLAQGVGTSEAQVELVLTQLRLFGFI
ncbi:hypothetical protein P2G74_01490 [Cronobacter muytjensii]|uniref:hypothetical protein n=1 Tax=Cronobacter muytjensii TaxID=413501 RepID=UPI002DB95AD4|nr:hypothetical protein [Cronobacter muytjensii]MEB8638646.1 hypothetical protein [Cronobacter muytjensii]